MANPTVDIPNEAPKRSAPLPDPANRKAFLDPVTGVLKAQGLCDQNEPGDLAIDVPENFALRPGQWKRQGQTWLPHVPEKPQREQDRETAMAKVADVVGDAAIPKKVRDAVEAIGKLL